ncbi:hypothetical protein GGI59_004489 [Rhizobium lentis]|uniref:Uncharacterized protein n=1 Tax=Rhizobium lentis TaxID=1138194 RepID=A0A7W9CWU3_9HYPH|nr:hypothetical protein [Rhizobium lentis]MBB4575674.1 hypothetical protein [Rhizobium lentis]MBB5552262.1 hypothetical protein [Rhizobium lentis]MBB5562800.1 hypothetical protein [Rhizobium lentis]MBB5570983.1 hypothetical protein [Rhizobium lentis]
MADGLGGAESASPFKGVKHDLLADAPTLVAWGYGNRLEQDIAASGFKTAETTDRSVLGCNKGYPPDRFDVMTPRQM